jgi:hypothetical protein
MSPSPSLTVANDQHVSQETKIPSSRTNDVDHLQFSSVLARPYVRRIFAALLQSFLSFQESSVF